MLEAQFRGMEGLAAERLQGVPGALAEAAHLRFEAAAVYRISENRHPDVGKVHADLMGAAGFELEAEQRHGARVGLEGSQELVMGYGVAAGFAAGHCDLGAVRLAAAKPRRDGVTGTQGLSPYQRAIGPVHSAIGAVGGELLGKPLMGGVALRHDEKSRGALVEPVHDAGPAHTADTRKAIAAVGDEGIHEGAFGVSRRGMHNHVRRFVDDNEVAILVDHAEGHFLSARLGGDRRRQYNFERVARLDAVGAIVDGVTIAIGDISGADQRLDARTAQPIDALGEQLIEAGSRIFLARGELQRVCAGSRLGARHSLINWPPDGLREMTEGRRMHPTDAADAAPAAAAAPMPNSAEARLQRTMKIVVVALGVLLFAGLATVAGRIIYLASAKTTQPPPAPRPAVPPEAMLRLPAGAQVRSMSLSGDRLAVHYEAAGAEGIAVYDLAAGRALTDIGIKRTAPD